MLVGIVALCFQKELVEELKTQSRKQVSAQMRKNLKLKQKRVMQLKILDIQDNAAGLKNNTNIKDVPNRYGDSESVQERQPKHTPFNKLKRSVR